MLSGKIITLGITACSPADQLLMLIRKLKKRGAQVHVIMTTNAVNFSSASSKLNLHHIVQVKLL